MPCPLVQAGGHTHAVSYDKASADHRKVEFEAAGCTEVEIERPKVGQPLERRA